MPWIVTKTPIDLPGCSEIVGVFEHYERVRVACIGAGTYIIANVVSDRIYKSGELLDVEVVVILDHRQSPGGIKRANGD